MPLTRPLLVAALLAGTPAGAPARAETVLLEATWSAAFGGASRCRPVTSAVVRCAHAYDSTSTDPAASRTTETCRMADGGPSAVETCHAALSGTSSGSGRMTDPDVAACATVGVDRFVFEIDTPLGYYRMEVDHVANSGGATPVFDVELVDTAVPTVQELQGWYTGGCGLPDRTSGAFVGTWTLSSSG